VVRSAAEASVLARFGAAGFMQRLEGKIGRQLRDCSFLQSFTRLQRLHLSCEEEKDTDASSLARALAGMTELQVLYLKSAPLSAQQLADVLARMHQLHELTLYDSTIPSLSFFSTADAQGGTFRTSLRTLVLNRLRQVPPADVCHLRVLRGLRTLTLDACFVGGALSVEVLERLRAQAQENNKANSAAQIRRDEEAAVIAAECASNTPANAAAATFDFPLLTDFSYQRR
jgi:hypothetical protein